MAYTPTNWQSGDTITSARLNKIEQGIASGGGGLLVTATQSGQYMVLDKTAGEILDVFGAGGSVVLSTDMDGTSGFASLMGAIANDGVMQFMFAVMSNEPFYATSENDYPSTEQPETPK